MKKRGAQPAAVPAEEVEALLDECQGPLIRYAYRLVHNRELAEDMVQEAFLRYVRKPLDYGEPRQRVAWLYRVTHNLCVDWLKRESKRTEIYERIRKQPRPSNDGSEIVALDRWQHLERLMDKLNDKQRQVILLFFQEGLSYKEIAEVTGYSMSNVGMLLHRGLKKLKKMLERDNIEFNG